MKAEVPIHDLRKFSRSKGFYRFTSGIPIFRRADGRRVRFGERNVAVFRCVLGGCALVLYLVTLTDPTVSSGSDLPMLAFAQRLAPATGALYSLVLLISVFSTATSCFYGYCTKLPENDMKTRMMWASALAGLAVSVMGFSNIVAFIYLMQGYLSFIFLALMIWNFLRIKKGRRQAVELSPLLSSTDGKEG